jgi:lipopolysaccharide transport system permease protein
LKEIGYYKDLIVVLTKKEIKVRYKNSYFGYFWSLLNPFAFALIFYFVFGIIMRVKMENYSLFLVTGLFPWQWISNSLNASTTLFLSNASIIKKINFPRNILPLANTLQDMFHFLCAIPVIMIFMLIYGQMPQFSWIYGVPLMLLIQLATVFGLSMLLSSLNLFFRDLEQITAIVLMFLFYPTPILYPVSMIPEKYKHLIDLNIFTPIIINWRSLLLNGTFDNHYLLLSLVYAAGSLFVGWLCYQKLRYRIAEVI